MHKKSPHVAGLFGRVDRLSVSVSVTLNTNDHMRNICHGAIVEVQRVTIFRHPINKTQTFV
jgi:hypothetical protein